MFLSGSIPKVFFFPYILRPSQGGKDGWAVTSLRGLPHTGSAALADFFHNYFCISPGSLPQYFFFKHSKPQHLLSPKQRLTNCRRGKYIAPYIRQIDKCQWPPLSRTCEFHAIYYLSIPTPPVSLIVWCSRDSQYWWFVWDSSKGHGVCLPWLHYRPHFALHLPMNYLDPDCLLKDLILAHVSSWILFFSSSERKIVWEFPFGGPNLRCAMHKATGKGHSAFCPHGKAIWWV